MTFGTQLTVFCRPSRGTRPRNTVGCSIYPLLSCHAVLSIGHPSLNFNHFHRLHVNNIDVIAEGSVVIRHNFSTFAVSCVAIGQPAVHVNFVPYTTSRFVGKSAIHLTIRPGSWFVLEVLFLFLYFLSIQKGAVGGASSAEKGEYSDCDPVERTENLFYFFKCVIKVHFSCLLKGFIRKKTEEKEEERGSRKRKKDETVVSVQVVIVVVFIKKSDF